LTARPWWRRHRWLLLRRGSQVTILGLFLAGPWFGVWWFKGNLASSMILDTVNLTDPLIALQSLVAGHSLHVMAIAGALTVGLFYLLVGGRAYCSWVCPVNIITDTAFWLRNKLGIPPGWQPPRSTRLFILLVALGISALTGTIAWEVINPITLLQRGLVFGLGLAWAVVLTVFLFDLLVSRRGWCGYLCPVGAFYGLLGRGALLRVNAGRRDACTDCGKCFVVCPEPQVITPALKGSGTTVVTSGDCTNCGRCIDVCPDDVFRFSHRFARHPELQ
jgi:ferredoxin-type protein NapH